MAKILGFIVLFFLVVAFSVVVAGQLGLFKGRVPQDLGAREGRFKAPSPTPNSVSSQADLYPHHPQLIYARVAPLQFKGSPDEAMQKLVGIVKALDRTQLVTQAPDYLYAQCQTRILRFTDDLEFSLDRSAGRIHVRSASRLGAKDFGVNRERVEAIRAQFEAN